MDHTEFSNSRCGRLVTTTHGVAFVPHPLPPELDLAPLIGRIAAAHQTLGELNVSTALVPNPALLIAPLQRHEALVSSRMEGTVTDVLSLLLVEAGIEGEGRYVEAREVHNHVRALNRGIELLKTLPISARLMKEMHKTLMSGLPANRAGGIPGEFKTTQNFIGVRGQSLANARYVPPPPNETAGAMADLERFIHVPDFGGLSPLVHAALVHYQFEAIHPFPDGNGRLGRLLIPIVLMERNLLNAPLLLMSAVFEERKDDYIDLMFDVSKRGAWIEWIRFFLDAVIESGKRTRAMLSDLLAWKKDSENAIRKAGLRADFVLLDRLLERPLISVGEAENALMVSYNTAKRRCDDLAGLGILAPSPRYSYPQRFIAPGIVRIIEGQQIMPFSGAPA